MNRDARWARPAVLAGVLFYVVAGTTQGQELQDFSVAGQIGGQTAVIDYQGNYAYIGEGIRLTILDVSQPSSPAVVSRTAMPGGVSSIRVVGDYAYLAHGTIPYGEGYRFQIVDVSDPRRPALLGGYDIPGYLRDVDVSEGLAFIAFWDGAADGGVLALDVATEPSSPTMHAWYPTLRYWPPWAVDAVGKIAYIAFGNSLDIVDFSTPFQPTLLAVAPTAPEAFEVRIDRGTAYLRCKSPANRQYAIQFIDVSDPTSPSILGLFGMPGSIRRLDVSSGTACVSDITSNCVWIVDVRDVQAPAILGAYKPQLSTLAQKPVSCHLDLSRGLVFVSCRPQNLHIVDIADPAHPRLEGVYDAPNGARRVFVEGNRAVLTDYVRDAIYSLDVSDRARPRLQGRLAQTRPKALHVANGLAYVASGNLGTPARPANLAIIDVRNPIEMTVLGECSLPIGAMDVCVRGGFAYVACGWYSGLLQIVDISDPTSPSLHGSFPTSTPAWSVDVVGHLAYVGCGGIGNGYHFTDPQGTLEIVSIADPDAPFAVGSFPLGGFVHVSGNLACLGSLSRGLDILDVSDPTSPAYLGSWKDETGFWRGGGPVYVVGALAYLVDQYNGLRVLDVGNPRQPVALGSFLRESPLYGGLSVSSGTVYLAADNDGLWILEYAPPLHTAAPQWERYD